MALLKSWLLWNNQTNSFLLVLVLKSRFRPAFLIGNYNIYPLFVVRNVMCSKDNLSDVLIAGGGLAGLSLGILLAEKGHTVKVFEKSEYPRQKVCGEFLAEESLPLLQHFGIDVKKENYPQINKFRVTTDKNYQAECRLKQYGTGISRLTLDHRLAQIAIDRGVEIFTKVNVTKTGKEKGRYFLSTKNGRKHFGKILVDCRGRMAPQPKKSLSVNSYVGVKYHVKLDDFPADLIEMHRFSNGYCGISRVDGDKYCLCYLTKADALKPFKGDFDAFESKIPAQNKFLAERLANATKTDPPVTTSNMEFGKRSTVIDGVLYAGDAGGFIPPVTGNGMSLAFRCGTFLSKKIDEFLRNEIPQSALDKEYKEFHYTQIGGHINKGKFLQNLFMSDNKLLTSLLFSGFNYLPGMMENVANQAFGSKETFPFP